MRRRAWFLVLLVGGASIASSVLLARQQMPTPNVPGQPTVARMLVINPPQEPVPVVLGAGGQVQPVTIIGTPSVSLAAESPIVTQSGRQGWEYRSASVSAGEDLNAAGADGWEAVGVLSATGGVSQVLLKRPR